MLSFEEHSLPRRAPLPGAIRAIHIALLSLVLLTWAGAAPAACPTGNISLFLPYPRGSQIEQAYNLLPAPWTQAFQSTLSLIPRPGRGGSYAVAALRDEKGDGCFLAGVQAPSLFFTAEGSDRIFTETTLAPPAFIASVANALWVAEDGPVASLEDFLRLTRGEGGKPGPVPAISGIGSYTDQHLATLQLNRATGITTRYLPVLGSRQAAKEVTEGRAIACWGYALSGHSMPGLRAIAVAGERRSPVLPAAPTFRELGVELVNVPRFGLGLISTAPERIRQELAEQLAALMADQTVREQFLALGFTPLDPAGSAAFLAEQKDLAAKALEEYPLIPKNLRRQTAGRVIPLVSPSAAHSESR